MGPKISYLRVPTQITISSNDTLAWETGTWKAFNSYGNGGNYGAMWKKTNNSWKIERNYLFLYSNSAQQTEKYKRALRIKNNFFIASSKEKNILCLAVIYYKIMILSKEVNLINNSFSKASILSSCLYIAIVIKINYDIAMQYLRSDGKTKALIGLTELLSYSYQYYYLILIFLSIVLTTISIKKKESKLTESISLILILLSVTLVFVRSWRFMV